MRRLFLLVSALLLLPSIACAQLAYPSLYSPGGGAGGGGGAPTGAAGGVLGGTYPNPGFASTTGTGATVQATSPTLVTPALGTPASGVATNLTGTASALTAGGNVTTPQGRLTLTTATPVMSADALAQTTVFYDCYAGNSVSVGATLAVLTIPSCEISMGLDAGVPHITSGSNYDIFAFSNSGVLALCAGPAWTSTTARGSGAGTTQIDQTNGGLWTNTVSLAHCWGGASGTTDFGTIAAHAGTYLGSLNATANGQTAMVFRPAAASGGTNNFLALYNAYQRALYVAMSRDSTGSWVYTTAIWRAANAGGTGSGLLNRVTWLDGLGQSVGQCRYDILADNPGGGTAKNGCDFNSTSATPGGIIGATNSSAPTQIIGEDSLASLGLNFAQAVENGSGVGTSNYLGSTQTMGVLLEVMQ